MLYIADCYFHYLSNDKTMKRLNCCILFLILILYSCTLQSQGNFVKYTFDFEFEEGLYQTFDEFKNNSPSIKTYAIVTINDAFLEQFREKVSVKRIEYIDRNGKQGSLKRKEVWGVCSDGKIYILINRSFQRIDRIGSMIYFTAQLDPEYNTASPARGSGTVTGVIVVGCLLDFQTGEILSYCYGDFLTILERDTVLYNEYISIKRKKKRKYMMFSYMREYNERNPIYFPEF